jgi:hypothetical protein
MVCGEAITNPQDSALFAHDGFHFGHEFFVNLGDSVGVPGMLGNLFQDFFFGFSPNNRFAVKSNISTI